MAHHNHRYTVWDEDQECWVLYHRGKFIGGDAIDAFGELEDTGATPFDIRKMQRIVEIAERHGGIYHLEALDQAAIESRLLITPDADSMRRLRLVCQLYAPELFNKIWGDTSTEPEDKPSDSDKSLSFVEEKPPVDHSDDWKDPIRAFDGWGK